MLLYSYYVYQDVVSQFEQRRWDLPARVFSAPIELYAEADIGKDQLLAVLREYGYQSVSQPQAPGQFSMQDHQLHLITRQFVDVSGNSPAQELRIDFIGQRMRGVRTPDGSGYGRLEPIEMGVLYHGQAQDRLPVRLDQVPDTFVDALLAVEDRSFYSHWGINPMGIARALLANMRSGHRGQGGSTLTQQLVKNLYLSSDRSYWRKVQEAIMAVSLEHRFSKDDILETYLNEVFVVQDGNRAIHGFGLASQYLFGKPMSELSLDQQALLIGMIKGPSLYNPLRSSERALGRRNVVLSVMQEQLSLEADWAALQKRPLGLNVSRRAGDYPAYMELVRQQLASEYPDSVLYTEGLRIYTSLRPWLQKQAQASLSQQLQRLETDHGLPAQGLEAAMVVAQPFTGEVMAVIGGRNGQTGDFNRALTMRRQTGSLLKPAVYLAALRSEHYHLLTPIDDSPLSVSLPEGGHWQPRNFSNQSHGIIPLYQGLAKSYNQSTARLGMQVGLPAVFDTLTDLGVDPRSYLPVPSVMLGTAEMSPLQVASMYQTLANQGYHTDLSAIRGVMDSEGEPLVRYRRHHQQRVAATHTYLVQHALEQAMREGTGRSAYQTLPGSLSLAGKTGTTDGRRDSWFAGWAGNFLAVTWVGYDNNQPMPLTGSTGALPIWTHLMDALVIQPWEKTPPHGVVYEWVLPEANARTSEECAGAQRMPFVQGAQPERYQGCGLRLPAPSRPAPDMGQPPRPASERGFWGRLFGN